MTPTPDAATGFTVPAALAAAAARYAAGAPEIISALMYTGAGSTPMTAAATAWDGLATELQSAATGFSAVAATLASAWAGPSAEAMAAAAAPQVNWLATAAAAARATAAQARVAAGSYEAAFAATVPPAIIAANRALLASLIATDVLGINTAAIAETESAYEQMWAQNAAMIAGYAASSAAATRLPAHPDPRPAADPAPAAAAAARSASAAPGAGVQSVLSDIGSLFSGGTSSPLATTYNQLFSSAASLTKFSTLANDSMGGVNLGMVEFKAFCPANGAAGLEVPKSALGAGLSGVSAPAGGNAGPLSAGYIRAVTADAGTAPVVGQLSVPPGFGTATPAIRLAASPLPATGVAATPAGAPGSGLLPGLGAGALGGAAPGSVQGVRARTKAGKTERVPTKIDRILAQMQRQRDTVQHWQVDEDGLDALLDELSTKPGFHAVHVADGTPAPARSG